MEKKIDTETNNIENNEAKQSLNGGFFKNAFTKYLTVSLSIIGLFIYFFSMFIGLVSSTIGGLTVAAWFGFLGWGIVVSGLIVFGIQCIKCKKFELSPEFVFSIISIIIVTL